MQNSVLAICFALVATASFAQDKPALSPSNLEAEIARLKTEAAALVASGRTALDALTPEQRLAAPPAIWRASGALREFRDCNDCPTMTVIPAGEFTMGAPAAELGGEVQHRVRLEAPFAVSKFEITFAEWDACVAAGGCRGYRPGDEGWGRGGSPAMNISWEDAKAYAAWLSARTGKTYRLLSEAEWEYAARAGTVAAYPYADGLSPTKANYDASTDGSGPSDVNRQRTVPVGSFLPNAFGLYDMQGNVSEWVEDCWNDEYTAAAPTDGSAWVEGDCKGHVVRGGSWEDSATELRSAARTGGAKDDRFYTDGVRVARSL
jgi:formylglycine-generating enzyme required for sulfatase activity